MSEKRRALVTAKRWVVKIGSSLLTANGKGLDYKLMESWVCQIATLMQTGREVIIVSSGAVAEGMARLGIKVRPHEVHQLQAAAALGQAGLVEAYCAKFQRYSIHAAQILLTHDDLADRKRYLNAKSTLRTLLGMAAVPIINENDTVITDEICFGDNDTLGALVVNLVEADVFVILTDQQGIFTEDPKVNPQAALIPEASCNDEKLKEMATDTKTQIGRGGMITKVRAAELAGRSGGYTVIMHGREKDGLLRLSQGEPLGTLLFPSCEPYSARKQWLAGLLQMKGSLVLDDGAIKVLQDKGSSLLPVGIKEITGHFKRGEVVACLDVNGKKIACGLINYSAEETIRIAGKSSKDFAGLIGYAGEPELIHRDNMVVYSYE